MLAVTGKDSGWDHSARGEADIPPSQHHFLMKITFLEAVVKTQLFPNRENSSEGTEKEIFIRKNCEGGKGYNFSPPV